MIPRTVLIACGPFGELSAERAGSAIARGLAAGGLESDSYAIGTEPRGGLEVAEELAAVHFDARMRAARAVVLGQWQLGESTLAASPSFEIATRARQAGVPAYAVTAEDGLSLFDARILDLQLIIEASGARALAAAGRRLATVV
jgi:glycerate 2-kinase